MLGQSGRERESGIVNMTDEETQDIASALTRSIMDATMDQSDFVAGWIIEAHDGTSIECEEDRYEKWLLNVILKCLRTNRGEEQ